MLKEKDAVIRRAMILLDASLVSVVFFLTFYLRRHIHLLYRLDILPSARVVAEMTAPLADYFIVLILFVPLWCGVLYMNGMYKTLRTKRLLEVTWIIIKSAFLTTIAFGTIVFIFKLEFISRAFFLLLVGFTSSGVFVEKVVMFSIMHEIRRKGYNYRKLLIVGTGKRALVFMQNIECHPEWGLKIAGVIDFEEDHLGRVVDGSRVVGTLDAIPRILNRQSIDEVVFVIPRTKLSSIENTLYVCETQGVKATIAVDLFDLKIAKARQTDLDGVPLLTFETTVAEEWQLFVKRTADIIISGLGIVALSPLFLAIAILIKLTSKGAVFYIQKRVGLNGRKFILYKFRSMHKGAHEKLADLLARNEMKGPVFKIKDDPRVTAVGRFLRRSSLDELPQLFNVFTGSMSLVGPRPPIPSEVSKYEPWQRRRLSMRPGITCLWQISGRNKIDFDDWMKLDLEYIDNWSLWLDFKILCKTIPVVLFGIGAY